MKKHVLLIDDDNDELFILTDALDHAGIDHKCTWAQGVEHGLEMLNYLIPDVIFIDFNMPKTNGISGIKQIRALQPLRAVPIILYSNCINEVTKTEALRAGATTCIQKPSTATGISLLLKEILLQETAKSNL